MWGTIISAIASVIVALVGLIGIIIQVKSHNKLNTQEELLNTVQNKVDDLREESKKDDKNLNEKLDNMELEHCKRFLIVEMTKIKDGTYIPNEEQKRMLHETKQIYNDKGGDSYVDSMFDHLIEQGLL